MHKNLDHKTFRVLISERELNEPEVLAQIMSDAERTFRDNHGDIAENTFVDVNTTGATTVDEDGQVKLVMTYHIVVTSGEIANV